MVKKLNLDSQVFGRLTVIEDDGTRTKSGKVKWRCRCECGNETHVLGNHLKTGAVKSCGCLNYELKRSRFKDLTGYENKNFKVIAKTKSSNQRADWVCECKHCGKITVLNSNEIELTKSCGCLKTGATKDYMDSIRDSESLKTTKPTAKSSTGVRGVYYRKNRGNYEAFINIDKKQTYLGSSKNFDDAVRLRREAEEKYGYK